ncbi:PP2C family protein-serine/threonine phosphatase [Streptomyces mobaraensis]|uniref:Serine/threonine-protein phosphatase n=1 Tax=Streptomyces mobaraensis TaxID=35621 RepID=A0A5N5WCU5_STRMB|nr:PP2C family protein-serine/threonine phosphatase [Streptomyces mobaraensis]KAB7848528.1 serine/threonine-protein phosphatase [Streptomyces mobaraensis]
MSAPHLPKVAGIDPSLPAPAAASASAACPANAVNSPLTGTTDPSGTTESSGATDPSGASAPSNTGAPRGPQRPDGLVQDRLAGWVSDLTTLQELTERLTRTTDLDDALCELLRAGATLLGAGRGLVTLHPVDDSGRTATATLGLGRADLGHLETIPHSPQVPHSPDSPDSPDSSQIAETPQTPDVSQASQSAPSCSSAPSRPSSPSPSSPSSRQSPPAPAPSAASHPYVHLLEGLPPVGSRSGTARPDIPGEKDLDPRHREVAARLGYAASYAMPLDAAAPPDTPSPPPGQNGPGQNGPGQDCPTQDGPAEPPPDRRIGAAVWLYDEPAEPTERQRRLAARYCAHAAGHLARLLELGRARTALAALHDELLPGRLPRVAGIRLAVRHRTGPRGGGDWYDALPLPEGALGLAVGGITGSGPSAVAATGRLRASLRAYAVMEGEDPVAVLSDLELLLRLTEPARSATALFAYCDPASRKVVVAAAGHCSPLIIGDHRTEYVETSLSAPLGMLACWEAPSVEIEPAPGETLLLYSDGLLHRTGDAMDRAFARLHAAAASVPRAARRDPEAVADHVLRAVLPDDTDASAAAGRGSGDGTDPSGGYDELRSGEDVVLLVAHFD